jgi:hypothetical protein
MAIAFTKYVDITSGVGAGAGVRLRDLIGRIFTTNELVPTKTIVEFTTIEEVGEYFGTSSEEYKRAQFYFSFISKSITRAKRIAFARWVDAAVAAKIFGNKTQKTLATYTAIVDGSLILNVGENVANISAINLSAATSLSDVATLLQTLIQAIPTPQFATATVTYDAVRGSFNFVAGTPGDAAISVGVPVAGTDLSPLLGWTGLGAILSDGSAIETITETLTESTDASNNFGSFLFEDELTLDEIEEAAAWNTTQNVLFQYMVPVTKDNAASYSAALIDYAGVALTVSEVADEYPEMCPMILLAATDYSRRNSVQNYMFQIFNLTPSVTTTTESNTLDNLRVNYYGQTQTAGQFIKFYQRGKLTGLPVNPTDQNTYANEQWLKDAAGAAIMELLLNLTRVSANAKGRGQLLTTLQSVINRALFNGTISIGKELTNTQKLYITELTGDPEAWQQVFNIGYWVDAVIERVVMQDDSIEYKAVYTLVYSKDDAIRKVEGSHVLI